MGEGGDLQASFEPLALMSFAPLTFLSASCPHVHLPVT